MVRLLIAGICGRMGANLFQICSADGETEIVCGVDLNKKPLNAPVYTSFNEVSEKVDVIIDFSSPDTLRGELEWAISRRVPTVLAATGYSENDLEYIKSCAKKIAVFKSPNFSVGISLLNKLVNEAAAALGESFDIEIVEKHHRMKTDAPSGTALTLAESANKAFGGGKAYAYGRNGKCARGDEIGIHAVRGGTIAGEHEIIFAGEDEIITLSHSALSKKIFASGALKAAKWIVGKPPGLYGMEHLIENFSNKAFGGA